MKYLKILLILFIIFPFLEYSQANDYISLSIQEHDYESDDFSLISSSGNDSGIINGLKSHQHLDLEIQKIAAFLFSTIYLIKRYQLLIVIKFNTSFYVPFF